MSYLKGVQEKITTENLKKLVGKRVEYLQHKDIDKSGRGMFFPRRGTITSIFRGHIEFDNTKDFQHFKSFAELVVID